MKRILMCAMGDVQRNQSDNVIAKRPEEASEGNTATCAKNLNSPRFWRCSLMSLVCGTACMVIASAQPASATEPPARGVEPTAGSGKISFHRMYIDHNNQVRVGSTRSPIALEQALAYLLASDRDTDELREAIAVMRKRMQLLNSEISGTQLAADRLQNQRIAIRRAIRVNEGQDQQSQPSTSQTSTSQFMMVVPPSANTYDGGLAKEGLMKTEERQANYKASMEETRTMKAQIASCLVQLEGELRYRNHFAESSTATVASRQNEKNHGAASTQAGAQSGLRVALGDRR